MIGTAQEMFHSLAARKSLWRALVARQDVPQRESDTKNSYICYEMNPTYLSCSQSPYIYPSFLSIHNLRIFPITKHVNLYHFSLVDNQTYMYEA
jgi:hypothetical protein